MKAGTARAYRGPAGDPLALLAKAYDLAADEESWLRGLSDVHSARTSRVSAEFAARGAGRRRVAITIVPPRCGRWRHRRTPF